MRILLVDASEPVEEVLARLRKLDVRDALLVVRWEWDMPIRAAAFRVGAIRSATGELKGLSIGTALRLREHPQIQVLSLHPGVRRGRWRADPGMAVISGRRLIASSIRGRIVERLPRADLPAAVATPAPARAKPPQSLPTPFPASSAPPSAAPGVSAPAGWAVEESPALSGISGSVRIEDFGYDEASSAPGQWQESMPDEAGSAIVAREEIRERDVSHDGDLPSLAAERAESAEAEPPSPVEPSPPKPTRIAYGMLRCPDSVEPGGEIELSAGLVPSPEPGIVATRLQLPDLPRLEVTVSVLLPDGVSLRPGESARNVLVATREAPYPAVLLHLRFANCAPGKVPIGATFMLGGEVIGYAVRTVAVGVEPEPVPSVLLPMSPTSNPADLTVTILQPDKSSGKLRWSFESPHAAARVLFADEPVLVDIGAAARDFPVSLMAKLPSTEAGNSKALLKLQLMGASRVIAGKVPKPFFEAVRAIAKIRGAPPAIFFLSQEPFVPWELMAFEPPLDPKAPAVLGAQADVGRWIFDGPPPGAPPPAASPGPMKVLSGGAGLQQGEDEAFDLRDTYGATSAPLSVDGLVDALCSPPPPCCIHVSSHGSAAAGPAQDGLVLDDGRFDDLAARGLQLSGRPFIFLNACEVGQGNVSLGSYAGLAAAFTYAGASGVVAPLWAIRDGIARSIVAGFYRALAAGTPVAAALRAVRASFGAQGQPVSATYLAWQFFGHPSLIVSLR